MRKLLNIAEAWLEHRFWWWLIPLAVAGVVMGVRVYG